MTPRNLLPLLAVTLAFALILGCGGDDDGGSSRPGNLSDPEDVPTATPWQQPPEVVILDPENLQPIPGDGNSGGEVTPTAVPGEPGVCGTTYTVVAGDTTFGIAEKCGVDPQDIIDANPDIVPQQLSVGQVITLPPATTEAPE